MKNNKIVHCVFYARAFIPQQIFYLNEWFSDVDQTFFVYGAPKEFIDRTPSNVRDLKQFDQNDFISEASCKSCAYFTFSL